MSSKCLQRDCHAAVTHSGVLTATGTARAANISCGSENYAVGTHSGEHTASDASWSGRVCGAGSA